MRINNCAGVYTRTLASVLVLTALAGCGGSDSSVTGSTSSAKLLPETVYGTTTTIVAEHSGHCLDVRGGPTAVQDGALIEQWGCSGEANQDWNLNSKGNGNYELIARSSNKCIEPINGATANNTYIQQATCDGSAKQLWNVRPKATAGRYEIVHAVAGRCLSLVGGPTATGEGVLTELWACTGESNQSWALTMPQSQPAIEAKPLVAKHSAKCLSVQGGPTATQDGAAIEQRSCNGQTDQDWLLKNMDGGLMEIIAKSSGKCLEVTNGNLNNEALIRQASCNGSASQRWQRENLVTTGEYRFRTALTGNRCLDVRGGPNATQNGALLELWDCSGEANQTWTIGQATTEPPQNPTPQPDSWVYCADEYGMCTFSGTRQVRYGADGRYATQAASNAIACTNEVFGDPYPGVNKRCEYSASTTAPPSGDTTPSYLIDYYGDSVVWGWDGAAGDPNGVRVAMPLTTEMQMNLSSGSQVRNFGVSGTTANNLLTGMYYARPWSAQMDHTDARYVIIENGLNDAGTQRGIAGYKSDLTQLAQIAKSKGKTVIFQTPNNTLNYPGADQYAQAMREVAQEQDVRVIDTFAYLNQYMQQHGVSFYSMIPDGLHPNQSTYQLMGRYSASQFSSFPK